MPPPPQTPFPTPPPVPAPHAGHRTLYYSLGALALGIAFVLGFLGFAGDPLPAREETPPAVQLFSREGAHTVYEPANIEFDLPEDWRVVSDAPSLALLDDVRFTLRKEGTACILGYARFDNATRERLLGVYKQTSFADRVMGADADALGQRTQFDSSWYLRTDYLPAGFEFQWEGKQALPHEVRIVPQFSVGRWYYGAFFLFDADGAIVDGACNDDMNRMLATVRSVYRPASLSAASVGFLYARNGNLLFVGPDDVPRRIAVLGSAYSSAHVQGNRIYYLRDNVIHTLDPFSQDDRIIPLSGNAAEKVSSFFVYGKDVIALVSADCDIDDYRTCRQRLIETDTTTGQNIFLADVDAKSIMGVNAGGDIYLGAGWGDAGCSSLALSRYSVRAGIVEKIGSFSACDGDANAAEVAAARTAALAGVDAGVRSPSIIVSEGALRAPEAGVATEEGSYDFVFVR